jgi:hypothetical protein
MGTGLSFGQGLLAALTLEKVHGVHGDLDAIDVIVVVHIWFPSKVPKAELILYPTAGVGASDFATGVLLFCVITAATGATVSSFRMITPS